MDQTALISQLKDNVDYLEEQQRKSQIMTHRLTQKLKSFQDELKEERHKRKKEAKEHQKKQQQMDEAISKISMGYQLATKMCAERLARFGSLIQEVVQMKDVEAKIENLASQTTQRVKNLERQMENMQQFLNSVSSNVTTCSNRSEEHQVKIFSLDKEVRCMEKTVKDLAPVSTGVDICTKRMDSLQSEVRCMEKTVKDLASVSTGVDVCSKRLDSLQLEASCMEKTVKDLAPLSTKVDVCTKRLDKLYQEVNSMGKRVKETKQNETNQGASSAASSSQAQPLMPQQAVERHNFEHGAEIANVAFLRCGIVIADWEMYLSLYTEEGRRLHQIKTDDNCCSLALLREHFVALVKENRKELQVLHATRQGFDIKVTEKLQKHYQRIAAVDEKTLAAAVWPHPEIDLLDLAGVVLKTIQTSDSVYRLCINGDRILIASLFGTKRLIKIHLDQGTEVLLQEDPKIPDGRVFSALPGGCFLVGDNQRETLCLMTEDGQWIRDLASLKDKIRGYLDNVSVCGEKVVCATWLGEIFVLSFV